MRDPEPRRSSIRAWSTTTSSSCSSDARSRTPRN